MATISTELADGVSTAAGPDLAKKVEESLKSQLETSKKKRKEVVSEWKRNVDARRGYPDGGATTGVGDDGSDLQSEINPDWALTKTKTANLYSQDPRVQGVHENVKYAGAVRPLVKSLNYELGEKRSNVGVAMFEVLNDVVNAAGIGAVVVSYVARFETVPMPQEEFIMDPLSGQQLPVKGLTPEQLQLATEGGIIHMVDQQRVADYKFCIDRISPGDLLIPDGFKRSNFDNADWVGYSDHMTWAEAMNEEWGLTAEDKEKVVGERSVKEDLGGDVEKLEGTEQVEYDELYYWRHKFDPDEKYFDCIWKIVYVKGREKPVQHGPWKGQRLVDVPGTTRKRYVGATKFPVRVLTLTYITDVAIPPSDTAAGRPQVADLRRSRSQMFQNRRSSIPMRWGDVNRLDPLVLQNIMRGTWQPLIPTLGDGTRAIGEVARASYPAEDHAFDRDTKQDLLETWRIGPNQNGASSGGRQTAEETRTAQSNFATDIGVERTRVASLFLGICEVLTGLMVLYSDFPNLTEEERVQMEQVWDDKHILHDLVFTIRPDSAIMLDTESQINRIIRLLNFGAQSGFMNPKLLLTKLTELSGEDPNGTIIDPQPKHEENQNVSYRFSGKDDLMNPMVVAVLLNEGKAPEPQHIEAAKKLLMLALMPVQSAPPSEAGPQGPPQTPGAPGPPPPGPGGSPGVAGPPPNPQDIKAHEDWGLAPTVAKRQRDI